MDYTLFTQDQLDELLEHCTEIRVIIRVAQNLPEPFGYIAKFEEYAACAKMASLLLNEMGKRERARKAALRAKALGGETIKILDD